MSKLQYMSVNVLTEGCLSHPRATSVRGAPQYGAGSVGTTVRHSQPPHHRPALHCPALTLKS